MTRPACVERATDVTAAYRQSGQGPELWGGRLRFYRTLAESVGVQGPTGGVVIGAAILAGISGGGTALVQVIAAIAMGFVAYAFVLFSRAFNSAGSVYGFTGSVAGPAFGFLSAWTLMVVYINFAGGVYAAIGDEAGPAFAAIGLHLPWQVFALAAFALVTVLAYMDIKASSTLVLILEGVSMLIVTAACVVILGRGGYHGHAFSMLPFRPNGASLPLLGLGVVYSFSSFSGFEAAATLGEESARPQRIIPVAVVVSLVAVAVYEIGVAWVVTNAFPSVHLLAASPVPLVAVTDRFVAPWVGVLVNFGAVVSSFGAALACANGASRMLFALGRDGLGPAVLRRVSRRTGSPVGALVFVAAASLGFLLAFVRLTAATQAVALILTYGADLILAAYVLVVIAAIVFAVRRRLAKAVWAILLVGLLVLGFVLRETFVPFPAPPYNWDAYGAAATLAVGVLLPLVSPRLRRGIQTSPLLRVGAAALLPNLAQPPSRPAAAGPSAPVGL